MAKSTIYLLQYNQYYNKIVKRLDTLEDYLPFVVYNGDDYKLTNNAFNPRDHIDAQLIVNTPDASYDYLLVVDEDGNIDSRWFVTEAIYLKAEGVRSSGQYQLNIHRDLLADYLDEVVQSPIYFERAIFNSNNPLIYNSENMLFNQIKTKESLIMDVTESPWVVAYLAREDESTQQPMPEKTIVTSSAIRESSLSYSRSAIDSLPAVIFGDIYGNVVGQVNVQTGLFNEYVVIGSNRSYNTNDNSITTDVYVPAYLDFMQDFSNAFNNDIQYYNEYFRTANHTATNKEIVEQLIRLNGKVIKNTDVEYEEYFTFNISTSVAKTTQYLTTNSAAYLKMQELVSNLPNVTMKPNTRGDYRLSAEQIRVNLEPTQTVTGKTVEVTIAAPSQRQNLVDCPWDMFAMPLKKIQVETSPEGGYLETRDDTAYYIAQALNTSYGKANIYDIQLLPFCPVTEYWNPNLNRLDITTLHEGVNYSYITTTEGNELVGIGFWVNKASFKPLLKNFNPILNPIDPIEFKINNECDMYRLVSPNYSSVFEFSATKNGGILGFEANCTYKPYQPMIHINPIFSNLYGTDFNDNRGLICGGNYSLPSTTNAWTEYQIQNKSYKESFERQIQNMETTYDINREQMKTAGIINSFTAGVQGFASGATAGGIMSGGNLAVAGVTGAVTGLTAGIGSAAGLAADLKYSDQLQKEALSYTTDMFNLSLQNIKALPNTLSNIGAFDINYKYFPFLEYYTATPQEKEALRKKLIYNGMTAGVISTISEMRQSEPTYMQGQLIRLNIAEDYHVAASIASEIHRGIYI